MRDGVVRGIKSTRELYGDVPIMVTGHSMGGAMAAFCALDLVVSNKICRESLFSMLRSWPH
jgi:putative lipase involved disintegration of autophagic bodies